MIISNGVDHNGFVRNQLAISCVVFSVKTPRSQGVRHMMKMLAAAAMLS
jgi:hypothetical protein